jgi:hypothetical protein
MGFISSPNLKDCLMRIPFRKGDTVLTMGAQQVVQGESPNARKYTVEPWLRSLAATKGTTRYQDPDTTSISGSRSVTFSMQARRTARTWTSVHDSESDSGLPKIKLLVRRVSRSQPRSGTRLLEHTRTGSRLWTILKNNIVKKKKLMPFPQWHIRTKFVYSKFSLEGETPI